MCRPVLFRNLAGWGVAATLLGGTLGCEQLPGTPKEQGTAIGGVGGAVTGAALGGEHHRLLGALIGGAAGAGGGYLIGANSERIAHKDAAAAQEAMQRAQTAPATAEQARTAPTADLNGDGFVTMDEVVAMRQAGLPDQTIVERLRATGKVFELNPDQQRYLRERGISDRVISEITEVNRDVRDRLLGGQEGVISRPPGQ
jgi:hypothetical protein